MTPPTGYCHARYSGSGAVKVPDMYPTTAVDFVIPGAVLGPGDIHIVSEGEAWESSNWTPCHEDGTIIETKPLYLMSDEEREVAVAATVAPKPTSTPKDGDD